MEPTLSFRGTNSLPGIAWQGERGNVHFTREEVRRALLELDQPLWAVEEQGKIGVAVGGQACPTVMGLEVIGLAPALPIGSLGDQSFCTTYGTRYAYYAGAMANRISSEDLVIALCREGVMGSFGAGGLSPSLIETAIQKVKEAFPEGPYAFNLLNSPNEPALEQSAVELYLKHQIRVVEASAYLALTAPLVQYRTAGLSQGPNEDVVIGNRVIAKLSRLEMAQRFLDPAPADLLDQLVATKKITPKQAELSQNVPMADDITVEADSGGHTDNRPLVCMIPAFIALRDQVQAIRQYAQPVRIGAAGGIGTPEAALAAFTLGAAYVVTGSVNQACVKSSASEHTRNLLAQMDMADVAMAPAGDMFEMGVRVQVLKRGTMFAMRAQKLYELYTRYNAWEEIPAAERDKLEKTIFKRDFDSILADTVKFFRNATRARWNAATPAQRIKWPWSSAGTWVFRRAGRRRAKRAARWTTRSGRGRPWTLSTIG